MKKKKKKKWKSFTPLADGQRFFLLFHFFFSPTFLKVLVSVVTVHVEPRSTSLLSPLVRLRLLAHLNNSVRVRISISYSILNMPKRATDKGQEAPASIRSFVADNRPTNSFCDNAHRIVSHQFCTWLSPPPSLRSSLFLCCFVLLMLLTSAPTPFPCLALSLHREPEVSGARARLCLRASVCVCVCVYVSAARGVALPGIKWRWSLEKSRLFFGVAEILLTNWMRCKSSQQASDSDVTHGRERASEREGGRVRQAESRLTRVTVCSKHKPFVPTSTCSHTHTHTRAHAVQMAAIHFVYGHSLILQRLLWFPYV